MRTTLVSLSMLSLLAACGSQNNCEQKSFGGQFCVSDSGVAPAGQPLTFQIIDQCHAGCGTSTLACTVSRDGGTLTLGLAGEVCAPPRNIACDLACALVPHDCTVPALEEGDYTVVAEGQSPRTLQVRDAGVARCTATFF